MFAIASSFSPTLKGQFHRHNPFAITAIALGALTAVAAGVMLLTYGNAPIPGGILIGFGAQELLVDLVYCLVVKPPAKQTAPASTTGERVVVSLNSADGVDGLEYSMVLLNQDQDATN